MIEPITWDEQISYKVNNIKSIRLYNCLNRRVAVHRQWLYLRLAEEGLVGDNLLSMDEFEHVYQLDHFVKMPRGSISEHLDALPLSIDTGFVENKFLSFNRDIYLQSWFTIVTETTATDNDDSVMITEKTIKPMMASHPFLVWGNRKTLRYLRDLGFKTFANSWDERYDTKYDFYRLDHLIEEVSTINSIHDKLEWFKRSEDMVRHNHELVSKMSWDSSKQCITLRNLWNDMLDMNRER